MIADITDGTVFRKHRFAQKATSSERDDLRVAWMFSYDDVELCKPLSTRAGVHNTAGFYAAVANLPAKQRFRHCYMVPMMLALESATRRCGMVHAVCGATAEKNFDFDPEHAAAPAQQLRQLHDGVSVKVRRYMAGVFICTLALE